MSREEVAYAIAPFGAEWAALPDALFALGDADGNGAISLAEFHHLGQVLQGNQQLRQGLGIAADMTIQQQRVQRGCANSTWHVFWPMALVRVPILKRHVRHAQASSGAVSRMGSPAVERASDKGTTASGAAAAAGNRDEVVIHLQRPRCRVSCA